MPDHVRTARLTLTLTIDGDPTVYILELLDTDTRVAAQPAFRLTKESGEVYDVHVDRHGVSCTCADATYRQHLCKHALGLRAVGLLPTNGDFPP